jgi:hypothetical protein
MAKRGDPVEQFVRRAPAKIPDKTATECVAVVIPTLRPSIIAIYACRAIRGAVNAGVTLTLVGPGNGRTRRAPNSRPG